MGSLAGVYGFTGIVGDPLRDDFFFIIEDGGPYGRPTGDVISQLSGISSWPIKAVRPGLLGRALHGW